MLNMEKINKIDDYIEVSINNFSFKILVTDFFEILSGFLKAKYEIKNGNCEKVLFNRIIPEKNRMYIIKYKKKLIDIKYDWITFSCTKQEFFLLCDELTEKANMFLSKSNCKVEWFSPNYLALFLFKLLPGLLSYNIDELYLEQLLTFDNRIDQFVPLYNSDKYLAILGKFDMDSLETKESNWLGYTNSSRLFENLNKIRNNGYPQNQEYIILYENDFCIMDGGHRAVCLYYLYGNVKINVMRLHFDWKRIFRLLFVKPLPIERINIKREKTRIVLYGAGKVGNIFKQQIDLARSIFDLVLWVDRKYDNCIVHCPEKIKDIDYDILLIAAGRKEVIEEIKVNLSNLNRLDKRVIW